MNEVTPKRMERRGTRRIPGHGGDRGEWKKQQSRSCWEEIQGYHPGEPKGGNLPHRVSDVGYIWCFKRKALTEQGGQNVQR